MQRKKVLIVGGVAGGATTAARLRRLDEFAEIVLFEKDDYISFANCGLPYYIGGSIPERDWLLVQSSEGMRKRFMIDVRTNSKVIAVEPARNSIQVETEEGVYDETYDVLVLCPGAEPMRLPADEEAQKRVYVLRNIEDTDRISRRVNKAGVNRAIVIGGGFIGLEMAENLIERGINVRLIEAMPYVLPPLDEDMSALVHPELLKHGVSLHLGSGVKEIKAAGKDAAAVTLQNGETYEADMIISAVGVRPATAFLNGSGIAMGPKGHIIADAHMRTNFPNIYAAGDAVQVKDFVLGVDTAVPLAGPANRQARVVADNIAGFNNTYGGVQGTAIIKLFGITAASTGANERTLQRNNIDYLKTVTHPFSHAAYYPGAKQFTAKLLFNREGDIFGCQMVGADGVDKRLDVVATAMRLHAKTADLCDLELAYAPPYSSAKDPVNMLGYVAENIRAGISDVADADAALHYDPEKHVLLDVRTPEEYVRGHVEGAVNIPLDELRDRLHELDRGKEILEYCQVGVRAHTAHRILKQHGFRVRNVSGGYRTLSARGKR